MNSWSELVEAVKQRAGGRCEYCRMHQVLQGATFHVEHVTPRSRGGQTEIENLALACPSCNLHKSDRVQVKAPDEPEPTLLFNPRSQEWSSHFRWKGHRIVGLTPVGRASVWALMLNHERRMKIREAEALFNLFPPSDD